MDETALASTVTAVEVQRAKWDELMDRALIEWGRNPQLLAAEDVLPPSRAVIRLAMEVARAFRDAGLLAPTAMVPDGSGGMAFERRSGAVFESLEIRSDGGIEVLTFEDEKLKLRRRLG